MRRVSTPSERSQDGTRVVDSRFVTVVGVTALFLVVAATLVVTGFFAARWAVAAIVPGPAITVRGGTPVSERGGATSTMPMTVIATASADAAPGDVEVPNLVGMRVDEAIVWLQTSGLTVAVTVEQTAPVAAQSRLVMFQSPRPGTVAAADSTVTLAAPPLLPAGGHSAVAKTAPAFTVCIDPGHQAHSDAKLESIGPGSKTQSPRATGGATGVVTGSPEYDIALRLSLELKRRLEAHGVRVILTRTHNSVRLSNAQRAHIANKSHADLFIRIHCGASTIETDTGCRTLYPAKNHWTTPIVARSWAAAKAIEAATVQVTGAVNRGVQKRAGVVGFNWSTVPVVMIETGYLSNPVEDRLLASPVYQAKVAEGIAEGTMSYLNGAL